MSRLWLAILAGAVLTFNIAAVKAANTLNVNTALSVDDPMYKGLEQFQAKVAERSGGELTIRLFPGSQLGKDEDVLEQARAGANVAVLVDGGRLGVFVKEFGVLGAPYVASGFDGIRKVVVSPLFDGWAATLNETAGLKVLSFNWWQGERHLLTNKEINQPADLEGIRMRTPGAPVWMETIRAMGATPTPMGWSEVYTALQQQVIDAAEAQSPATYGSRLYEVIKHITKTGHINLITGLVTSGSWFDGLPAEQQQILMEESLAAGDFASRLNEEKIAEFEQMMVDEGVSIRTIDNALFKQATEGVYELLGYSELRQDIETLLTQ